MGGESACLMVGEAIMLGWSRSIEGVTGYEDMVAIDSIDCRDK